MRKISFPRSLYSKLHGKLHAKPHRKFFTLFLSLTLSVISHANFAATGSLDPEASAVKFWGSSPATTDPAKVPGLTGIAGDTTHDIWSVEALRVLPSTRAVNKHREYANELAAAPGHVWYVIRGSSLNTSFDNREFRGSSIDIIDSDGNEYEPSWQPGIFQPASMQLRSERLEPGQYKHWVAFFDMPETVSGLQLRAGNMTSIEKKSATVAINEIQTPVQKTLGSIHHNVIETHQMIEIPAEWTVEKYADRAAPGPAKEGNRWVVVVGETINGGKDARKISSREVIIMDENGNEYRSASPGYKFKTENTGIKSDWLEPGASLSWKLFFQIPTGVRSPRLRLGILNYARKENSTLPLNDPAYLLQVAAPMLESAAAVDSSAQTEPIDENLIDLGNISVTAGEVEHTLVSAEVLATISASRLTKYWKDIGMNDQLPAPDNTVWIHVNGRTKNNAQDERSLKASFTLIDSQDREYEVNVKDTQLYVPEERSMSATWIQPGQDAEWEAWFLIHQDAEDLRIKLDDLTFLAEFTAEAPLAINNVLIGNRGMQ